MVSLLDEVHKRYMKSSWEKVYDLIPKDSDVFDIGCGKGGLLLSLSKKIRKGIGFDVSNRKIKCSKKRANELGFSNLEFVICSAKTPCFGKIIADVGIFSGVLHSLDLLSQTCLFKNSKKICKKLIILDYDLESLKYFSNNPFNPFVHIEELFAGHYSNFKNYLEKNILSEEIFQNSFKIPGKPLRIWEYG